MSDERCSTGKRIYWHEHLADRAITKAAERGELGPMRHYLCPVCDRWHLATKEVTPTTYASRVPK